MRVKLIIAATICFVIGNIVWPFFNEPKLFYVPLAVLMALYAFDMYKLRKDDSPIIKIWLGWVLLLACGNVIKQVFFSDLMKQINDYVWGGLITLWLIISIILKWETRKQQHGRK